MRDIADQAHHLSTQARDQDRTTSIQRSNCSYRLSNLLAVGEHGSVIAREGRAAPGRQHGVRAAIGDVPGIAFMPEAATGEARGLTCVTVTPSAFGATRGRSPRSGAEHRIAAAVETGTCGRPSRAARCAQGGVADDLFSRGLCLRGSNRHQTKQDRIIESLRRRPAARAGGWDRA